LKSASNADLLKKGIPEEVRTEIKTNKYSKGNNLVSLSDSKLLQQNN
jgi:hypothetical protein